MVSKGEHFCADAHLALAPRLMLPGFLARIKQIELAGQVERLPSNSIVRVRHVPVRFNEITGRRVNR